jgi:hypothetical protein
MLSGTTPTTTSNLENAHDFALRSQYDRMRTSLHRDPAGDRSTTSGLPWEYFANTLDRLLRRFLSMDQIPSSTVSFHNKKTTRRSTAGGECSESIYVFVCGF